MRMKLDGATLVALFLVILDCVEIRSERIAAPNQRSFTIVNDTFMKDEVPYQYISGTLHYWRVPYQNWESTFINMRAAGLSAVDTYLIWNLHEQEPGEYVFEGNLNFTMFFELAQKHELLVVLRPGPFIAAEVDLGGIPYWLAREAPNIRLRTTDASFLNFVSRWYNQALPLVVPYLYKNNGPIITVQVENEYGAYGCDSAYMEAIKNLIQSHLGTDIVYFTNNYPEDSYPICGACNGTLTTGDFGTATISGKNVSYYLDNLRKYNPTGPLVDTEFYDGWLESWGDPFPVVPTKEVIDSATIFLERGVSFNLYTFRGASNFGFQAGYGVTTTYDYDAALTEAGDPTVKYYALRDLFGKYVPLPPIPPPVPSPKAAYGRVQMFFSGTVFDNLKKLVPDGPVFATFPLTFELLKQAHGFVLYRHVIRDKYKDPARLDVPGLGDRATVLINHKPVGILDRRTGIFSISLVIKPRQTLDILVFNEGRGVFDINSNNAKGIIGNVSINQQNLTKWAMYKLNLPHYPIGDSQPFGFSVRPLAESGQTRVPSFYSGFFFVPSVALDTYLNFDGWRTGYAFVNGRNIGRYWPVQGPQVTLYVPSVFLTENQVNTVELFEIEEAPCGREFNCVVQSINYPILNATIPTINMTGKKIHIRQKGHQVARIQGLY